MWFTHVEKSDRCLDRRRTLRFLFITKTAHATNLVTFDQTVVWRLITRHRRNTDPTGWGLQRKLFAPDCIGADNKKRSFKISLTSHDRRSWSTARTRERLNMDIVHIQLGMCQRHIFFDQIGVITNGHDEMGIGGEPLKDMSERRLF